MAHQSNNTAIAVALQSAPGAFTTPTQPADLTPVSNLRFAIEGVPITNDEYTGSPVKNGDAIAGKRVTLSFNMKIRAPGGANPPAANAFVPGRILQAAKMTEVVTSAHIPTSPEALAAATTTTATLGTGAAATANLYVGMPLWIEDIGAAFKDQVTPIVGYTAGRVATLAETLGTAPTGSDYQIRKHLGYYRSITADEPPSLSVSAWLGGDRYDLRDCRVTGMRQVFPTTTRGGAAYPEIEVTLDCEIAATAEQAPPAVPSGGPVPLVRDGNMWFTGKAIGGSTVTVDLGLQADNPPNPNFASGDEPAELVSSTARVSMTRQKYAKGTLDTLALADAQAYHSFALWYGSGEGSMVMITVPQARVDYASPDLGGNFVMETGDLIIDVLDRGIGIAFPY